MKKLISIISAICMVITILPFSAYAANITPETSLDEFTRQLQELQAEYDDNYVSEITIENNSEFYYVDGEENIITNSTDDVVEAIISSDDFEIPFSAIEPYCELPKTSTYSLDNENYDDVTVDKETAEALGFDVDIEDDKAVLTQPYQTERLIVKSKYDINPLDSIAIVEGYNDLHIVQFDNQESTKQAEKYYNKQKLIEYAEPDLIMSTMEIDYVDKNSTFINSMGSHGSHLSWGSDSIAVDDFVDTLSEIEELPEIVVGTIDTGIDLDHEFLKDRIIETNYNTSSSGITDCEDDDEGHGTHVAGIIADNTTDNVKIKAYKTLNSAGSAPLSKIINAIDFAVLDGVNVINMSLSGKGESNSMRNSVNRATRSGVVVCVAAGNNGADSKEYTPACIESCITVAAIDEYDLKPFWSNWGEDIVDIVAPGVAIYSTYNDGKYETLSGTSMACPFVAASAALLLSKNINQNTDEICDLLTANGREWTKATNNGLAGILALFMGDVETLSIPRVRQPYFSVESGRYMDSITVEIICDDKDAKIYYTTDGTRATDTNGTLYTEPIVIDKVTTLSASAYAPDKLKSIQMTAHYYITYLDDDSNFEIDSNGIITKYYGTNNYLTVPDTIKGITVTGIGYQAFMNSDIVMIKLPDSVTTIGESAFNQCYNLYSVDAKNINQVNKRGFRLCSKLELFDFSKLSVIKESSFASCESLAGVNGDNIETIEKYAFNKCGKIINVNIPKCSSLGDSAFGSDIRLEHISMENMETIAIRAFIYCKRIQELYLPNLKSFHSRSFDSCTNLTSVYMPQIKTIDSGSFSSSKNLELLFAPELETLKSNVPSPNCKLYLSNSFISGIEAKYNYTIIAPNNSYAQQWAKENGHTFIPSDYRDTTNDKLDDTDDLNVRAYGRSIRITNAGLRFGFSWDSIPEIENLASKIEYGFIYHYNYDNKPFESDKLTVENVGTDNVKMKKADNLDDTNESKTVFNLVFVNIPDSNQSTNISVRAYVCIDGMYFYSNALNGSFSEVSNLVLADEEIDNSTKTMVKQLLKSEV